MTRVQVDGWHLTSSAHRGIGTYVRNLLAGLEEVASVTVTTTHCTHATRGFAATVEHALHAGRVERSSDVLHVPGLPLPVRAATPLVSTIHDVFPLVLRDRHYRRDRATWRLSRPGLRRTTAVIAVSRFTANEAMRVLGVPAHRIEVVHPGLDPSFVPGETSTADPYVLLVAGADQRKGHASAFAAIAAVAAAGMPHRLVVAGRIPPSQRPVVESLVAASPAPERIDLVGYVSDLPMLYRGAAATLVSSVGEGFGYPAAESLACGTPVVAFANSATSEVVGSAGILVRDGDTNALGAALVDLLRDDTAVAELRVAGPERARAFDRRARARDVAAVYAAVAG